MKRMLALLTTLLMVLSLFPAAALAEDEPVDTAEPTEAVQTETPEPTAEPTAEPTEVPVMVESPTDEPTPEASTTPEPEESPALVSESPALEAAFLRLLGCDRLDADGTGYMKVSCQAGEELSLKVNSESNAELSYRWQLLDAESNAEDPYVDIDTTDEPTADEQTLSITADAALLGVEDVLRCVVTAIYGDETLEAVCYFTLEEALPSLDMQAAESGELDLSTSSEPTLVGSTEALLTAIGNNAPVIYATEPFTLSQSIEIPDNIVFVVVNTTLTIPQDITVTNHNYFGLYNSTVDVSGTINNYNEVSCGYNSTLNIQSGVYTASGDNSKVTQVDDGVDANSAIYGISNSQIDYESSIDSAADWSSAFSRCDDGYHYYRFTVNGPVTLTGTIETPSNMEVYVEDTLTIDAGAVLTLNGSIELRGGSLVNNGTIVNNGNIYGSGSFINNGALTGGGGSDVYAPISSETQLREALTSGITSMTVNQDITLSYDLTIPSGVHVSVCGATLAVPTGKTLVNEGSLSVDMPGSYLSIDGTLQNSDRVYCWNGGVITFQNGGAYDEVGSNASLEINDYGTDNTSIISGTDIGNIGYHCDVLNAQDYSVALSRTNSTYRYNSFYILLDMSFSENTEVPVFLNIWTPNDLTIAEDATLTIYGSLDTAEGTTLTNNGTIINEGSLSISGAFVNNGTLTGNGNLFVNASVSTEAELRDALNNGFTSINIEDSFTLETNLTIDSSDVNLRLNGAILTIPSGVTFQSNAWIDMFSSGGIVIQDGGSLVNNNGIMVHDATFTVESGGSYTNGENGNLYQQITENAIVSGLEKSDIVIRAEVYSESDIQQALTFAGTGYRWIEIHQLGDITLTEDLTLSSDIAYTLEWDYGVVLRVPIGVVLTNDGYLTIGNQCELLIDADATLVNNGQVAINGTYTNNGNYSGDGTFTYGEVSVYSWDELKDAVETGKSKIYIDDDITVEESITIPSGTFVGLDSIPKNCSLTVPDGVTLTLETDTELYMNAGAITIQSGASLVNYGYVNIQGGTFTTQENSTFMDYASVDIVGTATAVFQGTYTPGQDHWFSYTDSQGGATISGIDLQYVFYWADVNDINDINNNLPKALDGYRYFDLYLRSDLTLPADFEFPAEAYFAVTEGTTLTITAGNTATVSGWLNIDSGATLEIQAGATLIVADDAKLNIEGTLTGEGTISGNFNYSANITSDSDLRIALAAGVTSYFVTSDFSLESDFTLPDGSFMSIEDATLTVPSGMTMTNRGQLDIQGGTLLVQSGATLDNRGGIWIYKSTSNGVLTISDGADYIRADDAWTAIQYGEGDVNGIAQDQIGVAVNVTTESALKAALLLDLSGYRDATVSITAPITLTSNAKVLAGVVLEVALNDEYAGSDGLTIASGVTLTNAGTVRILENNTLVVNGTLANIGEGMVEAAGELVENGSVTYADNASVHRYVSTEEALLAAVAQNTSIITFNGDITLTGEVNIPNTVILEAGNGATLTIGDGAQLNLGATRIWLYQGSLVVAEGGTLIAANHSKISIWGTGSFVVEGTLVMNGDASKIYLQENGTASFSGITGENVDHVYAYFYAYNQDEVIEGLNLFENSPYPISEVYPINSMELTEDITVPNGADLILNDGATLTVPEGRTLTIAEGGYIRVESTGGLIVNGTLENYGKAEFSANVKINGSYLDHSSDTSYTMQATTLAQLKTALASSLRPLTINCSGFTINSSITIPSGITVMFNLGTTATVAKGYTVTVNGAFGTKGALTNAGTITNNNQFSVEWGGTLTNTGTLVNNGTADVYGTLLNNATVTASGEQAVCFYFGSTRGGTNASGSWYKTEGQLISSMTVTGEDTIGIGETLTQTYGITVLPSDAWSHEVTWSIADGIDYATIDETTGVLTGIAEGTVKIRATAADGSEVFAEKTINVVSYSVDVSSLNDWVLAGKTLQLTASLEPSNLTGTTTRWSLAAEDAAYATISATGLLTAKLVTEQHTVTVTASSADGMAKEMQKTITIYPVVSSVKIMKAGEDVTGQTLTLNSYAGSSLELTASLYPADANVGVNWTMSTTDALTLTAGADKLSATLTPVEGKTGLVTLTAKSNDGSGISSTVKIQLIAQSNGVTVSGAANNELYAGKTAQLIATFTDPQPSNRAVKWVLAPEYDAYATLSTTGLLTAKAVTDAVTIQVFAVPLDGGPSSPAYEVTLKPLATAVVIMRGDAIVTGTTQKVDMGHETSLALTAQTWPDAASDEVTWTSSAPLIASVDAEGTVSILSAGTAIITATATDGSLKSAKVTLTITSLPQGIEAVETDALMNLRGGAGATYTVKDASTGNTVAASLIRWTLAEGNAAYASITTAGVLKTSIVPTVQTIKLRAEVIGNESIAYDTIDVTIYPAVQSMSLKNGDSIVSGTTLTMNAKPGESVDSITLNALLLPLDSMQGVVWSSSNTNVARVTDGVVSAVWNATTSAYNKGTAVITAKATDGSLKSASVTVQVIEGVQSISFNVSDGTTLDSGKSLQLYATADNTTATNKKINLSIFQGAEYVTLSAGGLLTAKTVYEDQTIVVKAASADGYATKELSIIIPAKDNPLRIKSPDGSKDYSGTLEMIDFNGSEITRELRAEEESPTGQAITWSVAPSYVAKVVGTSPNFQLQALTTGVAVVTAKTADGKTASFTVEIYRGATDLTIAPPKGMDAENLTLASGKSMLLTGAFTPATGITTKGIVWTLSEEGASLQTPILSNDVATITASGLLTAKPNLTEPVEVKVKAYSANAPYLTSNELTITLQPIVTGLDIVKSEDDSVLSNSTVKLDYSDGTLQLGAVAYPSNASQDVVWTSSSKLIATVSDTGLVTAVKAGTVTITAKATDGSGKIATMKLTISVRVQAVEITSAKGFEVRGGSTLQLGVAFTPTTPTDKRVTWSLSPKDAQFATISSGGLLTTKAVTNAVTVDVTVTSVDNPDATFTQEVTIRPATTKVLIVDESENDLTGKTITLDLNSASPITLLAQNLPTVSGGAIQGVTWKTSSATIIKVTDGVLEPVKNALTGLYNTGTATITATATDGSGKTATIKVVTAYLVKGLTFASGLTVQGGKTLTLKPTFDPLNATNKTVKWSIQTSDTPYATITSTGVLTAKKVTAAKDIVVICAAQDGSGITAEITVSILP